MAATKLWLNAKTLTYQMSDFDADDHVEFDDIVGNMSVSGGSGQAKGVITIPAGYPNQEMTGEISFSVPPGHDDNSFISYQWFNLVTASYMGNAGTYSLSPLIENKVALAYTGSPGVPTTVELRVTEKSGPIRGITSKASFRELEADQVLPPSLTGTHVYAEYSLTSNQVVPTVTEAIVNYATQISDSHNSITIGASWNFEAQYDGMHVIRAGVSIDSWNQDEDDEVELRLYKNGVFYCVLASQKTFLPKAWHLHLYESYPLLMAVGDQFNVRLYNNTSESLTILGNPLYSRISIARVKE